MDREDRRRFFIVGSVILEIVNPLFRQHLENDYKNNGFSSLQAFLNSQPIIHILFHLRHRIWCCSDRSNCFDNHTLPLFKSQWKILYDEKPGLAGHKTCHCKFIAKPVKVENLDINLTGLILQNCCTLTQRDKYVIDTLRQYKNDYLSHNLDGTITEDEYNSLWTNLSSCILHIDATKQDDLVRITNRPLDDALCRKYTIDLLEIHQKLDQMDTSIKEMHADNIRSMQGMQTDIKEILCFARRGAQCQCYKDQIQTGEDTLQSYRLGENIFTLHHQTDLTDVLHHQTNLTEVLYNRTNLTEALHHQNDLTDVLHTKCKPEICNGVMLDDGRLVLVFGCTFCSNKHGTLLIYKTDASSVDCIPLQYRPWGVTAVNNSTVAVTKWRDNCIEVYDINSKHKLKSIQVPNMSLGNITTINNKLVVGCFKCLLIFDPQTGNKIKTIDTPVSYPSSFLYAFNDKIFYGDNNNHKLNCSNYSSNQHSTVTLPSRPFRITTLHDGSLYVVCTDGSVQHVTSDAQHYTTVTTEGLESIGIYTVISYYPKQRKLITCTAKRLMKVFNEM